MSAAGATSPSSGPGPVFVAGASGKVGQRIVRELAAAGVPVRAGCRDEARARAAVGAGVGNVSYVGFDVKDEDGFVAAIGDAKVVISALGASEGLNLLQFAQVDGFGVAKLMKAAAGVDAVERMMIVSSIGVGKPFGFPAALLNLFGGVLLWKEYSENAMIRAAAATGKEYFIVRPGGMERAKDDFKETHNVVLKPKGALSGGVISRLQVAELIAAAVRNPEKSRNKIAEAVAETTEPKKDYVELLSNL
jgi:uncharacterized protein YbjT (DUF2867 family)